MPLHNRSHGENNFYEQNSSEKRDTREKTAKIVREVNDIINYQTGVENEPTHVSDIIKDANLRSSDFLHILEETQELLRQSQVPSELYDPRAALDAICDFIDETPFMTEENMEALLETEYGLFPPIIVKHRGKIREHIGKEISNKLCARACELNLITSRLVNSLPRPIFLEHIEARLASCTDLESLKEISKHLFIRDDISEIPGYLINLLEAKYSVYGDITFNGKLNILPKLTGPTNNKRDSDLIKKILVPNFYDDVYNEENITTHLAYLEIPMSLIDALARRLGGKNSPAIFYNLDQIKDFEATDTLREEYEGLNSDTKKAMFTYCMQQLRYKNLSRYIDLSTTEEVLEYIDVDSLYSSIINHFDNGNYILATEAWELVTKLGKEVEAKKQTKLDLAAISKASTKEKVIPANRYDVVNLQQVAVDFYIMEGLLAELNGVLTDRHNPKTKDTNTGLTTEPREFRNIRDRASSLNLLKELEQGLDKSMDWSLHYLALLISSELKNQFKGQLILEDKYKCMPINTGKICEMTREELYIFFHRAKGIFDENKASTSYGGEKWSHIAYLGEMVTESDSSLTRLKPFLLDAMFDVEHNSGHIFDKDTRIQGLEKLKHILDIKANTQDSKDLISTLLEEGIISMEEFKKYLVLVESVKKLNNAPLRTKGYE